MATLLDRLRPLSWKARRRFREEVVTHLGFLRDLGYEGPEFTVEWTFLGATSVATFTSDARQAVVQMQERSVWWPGRRTRRHGMIALLFRVPRRGTEDDLSCDLFMGDRRPELSKEMDRLSDEAPSIQAFTASALSIYARFLREDARDIVAGREWQQGFIHEWE